MDEKNERTPLSSSMSCSYKQNTCNNTPVNTSIGTPYKIMGQTFIVFLICFGCYTPYAVLETLQTSVNGQIGTYSITIRFVCSFISSFFGPTIVHTLTPKWSLFGTCLCYMLYTIANFYPTWYILVPAGAIMGASAASFSICFGVYGTSLGLQYANMTSKPKEGVLSRINGFMTAAIPLGIVTGNFCSSFILKNVKFDNNKQTDHNIIYTNNTENVTVVANNINFTNMSTEQCGPLFCPGQGGINTYNVLPDMRPFYVLVAVLCCFNIFAIILVVFGLQNLSPEQYISQEKKVNLKSYLKSFFDWRFFVLTPFMTYLYLFLILFLSMFPRAYITCTIGVNMIGYITMARGVSDLLTCTMLGFIGQCCPRSFWLGIAYTLISGIIVVLFLWDYLLTEQTIVLVLFVLSAVGGIANSINISQYNAFLGATFTDKKTEAFSFFQLVRSLVGALGFYSNVYLCVQAQLCTLVAITVLAGVMYVIFSVYLTKIKTKEDYVDNGESSCES